jgi:hypothetical protein
MHPRERVRGMSPGSTIRSGPAPDAVTRLYPPLSSTLIRALRLVP